MCYERLYYHTIFEDILNLDFFYNIGNIYQN